MDDTRLTPLLADYARTRDRDVMAVLVEGYLPLCKAVARRFRGQGVEQEDLEQVAAIALMKAIDVLQLTNAVDYQVGYGYLMGSGDGEINGVWEVYFVQDGETVYKVNLDAVTGEIYYIEPDEEGNG